MLCTHPYKQVAHSARESTSLGIKNNPLITSIGSGVSERLEMRCVVSRLLPPGIAEKGLGQNSEPESFLELRIGWKMYRLPGKVASCCTDDSGRSPLTCCQINPQHAVGKRDAFNKAPQSRREGSAKEEAVSLGGIGQKRKMLAEQKDFVVSDRNAFKEMLPVTEPTVIQWHATRVREDRFSIPMPGSEIRNGLLPHYRITLGYSPDDEAPRIPNLSRRLRRVARVMPRSLEDFT